MYCYLTLIHGDVIYHTKNDFDLKTIPYSAVKDSIQYIKIMLNITILLYKVQKYIYHNIIFDNIW